MRPWNLAPVVRPEGERVQWGIPFNMIERLTREQGYNFAEAIHNRLEALRQAGIIGVSHERLDSLHGMYLVEMYILKPLPGEFLPEQYRLNPQPAGLPAPKVQD